MGENRLFIAMFVGFLVAFVAMVLVASYLEGSKEKANCENLIAQERHIYHSSSNPENHNWGDFMYYWDLPTYNCGYNGFDLRETVRDIVANPP